MPIDAHTSAEPPIIFISYSRADSSYVNSFLASLTDAGFARDHILCDATGLVTAVPYKHRIAQWLHDCDIFVAIYSAHFFFSTHCWHELVTALRYSQVGFIKLFIPVTLNKHFIFLTPLASFQFHPGLSNVLSSLRHPSSELTADYRREFKSLFGLLKYRIFWPLLRMACVVLPRALLTCLFVALFWCSFLFSNGRVPFRDIDRFDWRKARAAADLTELADYRFDQSPVCETSTPILWPSNICAQIVRISRNHSHVVLSLRIWSRLVFFPSKPLCSFPNTTFAAWIRLEFIGPNAGPKTYRIVEAILPKEDGIEARIDDTLDLATLMHQFTKYKQETPILKNTGSQEKEFLDDFSWLTRGAGNPNDGAQEVKLHITSAWCMPFFYDTFYKIAKKFVNPPIFVSD